MGRSMCRTSQRHAGNCSTGWRYGSWLPTFNRASIYKRQLHCGGPPQGWQQPTSAHQALLPRAPKPAHPKDDGDGAGDDGSVLALGNRGVLHRWPLQLLLAAAAGGAAASRRWGGLRCVALLLLTLAVRCTAPQGAPAGRGSGQPGPPSQECRRPSGRKVDGWVCCRGRHAGGGGRQGPASCKRAGGHGCRGLGCAYAICYSNENKSASVGDEHIASCANLSGGAPHAGRIGLLFAQPACSPHCDRFEAIVEALLAAPSPRLRWRGPSCLPGPSPGPGRLAADLR